ncbi:MAG: aldehyde ferredoxin oxidoreductase C-terminal domain-containing protein, partial [Desulfobacterales bacterium]|nr:aldehyde ferredoxin oxidoreductase C-terminal domain-containing protein [Desulfobacterales bacterium]
KPVSVDDLLEIASRISAQERCFAIRGGVTRDDDTLPKKLVNHRMAGTWPEDEVTPEEMDMMKEAFYDAMGWDRRTGTPRNDTLQTLDLGDLSNDLDDAK